tara:strand:- start:105 stop:359 length:255 start_codon:yes stop_codon:yes gene_type:complete
MSQLTITIDSDSTVVVVPAITESFTTGQVVEIISIYDNPAESLVQAEVDGIGIIKLDSLSDGNYVTNWTNSQVATAVKNYIQTS